MKLCSRCKQPNPDSHAYCNACRVDYDKEYNIHRREKRRQERVREGVRVKKWAYAYNLETGKLSEYSPSAVTHIDEDFIDTIQARYNLDEWHLTRNNYGPMWPIRDRVKFKEV